jgi:hypothetical protein
MNTYSPDNRELQSEIFHNLLTIALKVSRLIV